MLPDPQSSNHCKQSKTAYRHPGVSAARIGFTSRRFAASLANSNAPVRYGGRHQPQVTSVLSPKSTGADHMTDTAAPAAPKKKRKLLISILVALLLIGGGTAGWFAWNTAETTRQAEARAVEEQHAADEDAAKKKAASDAFWAKIYSDNKAAQSKAAADDAAQASADRAAVAKALGDAGWTEKAPGIYYAESPDNTCSYTACSKFNVMITLERGCPSGITIRGRWLNGETVTGSVFEVTGPLYANEQAAVEAKDFSGKANSIDLTEFTCR